VPCANSPTQEPFAALVLDRTACVSFTLGLAAIQSSATIVKFGRNRPGLQRPVFPSTGSASSSNIEARRNLNDTIPVRHSVGARP